MMREEITRSLIADIDCKRIDNCFVHFGAHYANEVSTILGKSCSLALSYMFFFVNCIVQLYIYLGMSQYEPRYEKTGFLHMRKQRRRSASR